MLPPQIAAGRGWWRHFRQAGFARSAHASLHGAVVINRFQKIILDYSQRLKRESSLAVVHQGWPFAHVHPALIEVKSA